MSELITTLDRSTAAEQIARLLYQTIETTELPWDCAPMTVREEYRARARESVRSCLDFAVSAAREAMARTLAMADHVYWDDIGPTTKARYRYRALEASQRYRWHLAESAYPEAIERQMGLRHEQGQNLASLVDATRTQAREDWRTEFAREAKR
jgi:hypothetical protein